MDNNIQNLKSIFNDISKRGWIKSTTKGTSGGGQTFEHLIGKPIENFELPDYEEIEIKVRSAATNQFVTMFSATPDGTYMFEIKRLRETYGYPDKKMKNVKVFNISVYANKITAIGFKYFFKLLVDRNNQKLFLCVFDRSGYLIDKSTFWSFELLKEKLQRKMQTLAIISATYKKELYDVFYKYNNIKFYKLKEFNSFIDAIEHKTIRVTFKISSFRNGKRCGQIHDHGTSFDINENKINDLYESIQL
jgi:hypothetical protein